MLSTASQEAPSTSKATPAARAYLAGALKPLRTDARAGRQRRGACASRVWLRDSAADPGEAANSEDSAAGPGGTANLAASAADPGETANSGVTAASALANSTLWRRSAEAKNRCSKRRRSPCDRAPRTYSSIRS